jgi:formylglycine-generating enzyme required for sulfatase activity
VRWFLLAHKHPVVQVSYEDALAYAKWVAKRLPTEAEWEFAARGGLNQATYAWGDQLEQAGQIPANIWDVKKHAFPVISPMAGGAVGTSASGTYQQNGYDLSEMIGNAWQWVSDWYRADYFVMQTKEYGNKVINNPRGPSNSYDPDDSSAPVNAPKRVIRADHSYVMRITSSPYRPSARRGADPYSPMSHLGFRLVKDAGQ